MFISCYLKILFSILYTVFAIGSKLWPQEIDVGLIANGFSKTVYSLAVDDALESLINSSIVPNNFRFSLIFKRGCDDTKSLNGSMQMWNSNQTSVIIGPECEAGISVVALMAALKKKPIIGYMTMSNDMSNRQKYTTFSSVSYTMSYIAQAVRAALLYHNWTRVALVRTHPTNCTVPFSGVPSAFQPYNITIANDVLADLSDSSSVFSALKSIMNTARIIVLCAPYSPRDAYSFLRYANQSGMITKDYVYVVPWTTRYSMDNWKPWLDPNVSVADSLMIRTLYKNVLVVLTTGTLSQPFKDFQTRLIQKVADNRTVLSKTNVTLATDDFLTLAPFRDALYLYGIALNKSIEKGLDINDGHVIYKSVLGAQFTGITDSIVIDDNGERASNYYVSRLVENSTGFPNFLLIGKNNAVSLNSDLQVINVKTIINWSWDPIPSSVPPPDVPVCGFQGEFCAVVMSKSSTTSLATGLAIVSLIVGSIIIGIIVYYKKRSFERDLQQFAWRVDLNKLTYTQSVIRGSAKSFETVTHHRINSLRSIESDQISNGGFSNGSYKNQSVFIKRWQRQNYITMNRDQLVKLKWMTEMVHENVARFVGFSIESDKAVLCLWSYCAKRSLSDILFNTDMHLDFTFQVSILRDIVSGLEYIHTSSIAHHGRLFTTKCLVDGRWIVKLSGFGVHEIIQDLINQRLVAETGTDPMDKLLCTAPEVLRSKSVTNIKAVDVYQFGMIAYQVLYRDEPFYDSHLENNEILSLLQNGAVPSIRPTIKPVKNCDSRLLTLLQNCWLENPANRPAVSSLKKDIFAITKKFGNNLIDHIMNMLEKYASNLEKVVDERTSQLNEERKRADSLLNQMLPKTVADALKAGNQVHPESFECATVFFSDIVGFRDICGKSSPLEVVSMLNNLYAQFDEIILQFDAYKVETIGDSYLVVSGLPIRNGLNHVTNICDMALKILQTDKICQVPHLPDHAVQVRIGIHSGPVAAGVIGLAMPKFCLFGDTVNFASRMETNGEANEASSFDHGFKLTPGGCDGVTLVRFAYVLQMSFEFSWENSHNEKYKKFAGKFASMSLYYR